MSERYDGPGPEAEEIESLRRENERLMDKVWNKLTDGERAWLNGRKSNKVPEVTAPRGYYGQKPAAPGEPPTPVVGAKPEASLKQRVEWMEERIAKLEGQAADNWAKIEFRLQALEAMAVKLDTSPPIQQPAWFDAIYERLAKLEERLANEQVACSKAVMDIESKIGEIEKRIKEIESGVAVDWEAIETIKAQLEEKQ